MFFITKVLLQGMHQVRNLEKSLLLQIQGASKKSDYLMAYEIFL